MTLCVYSLQCKKEAQQGVAQMIFTQGPWCYMPFAVWHVILAPGPARERMRYTQAFVITRSDLIVEQYAAGLGGLAAVGSKACTRECLYNGPSL